MTNNINTATNVTINNTPQVIDDGNSMKIPIIRRNGEVLFFYIDVGDYERVREYKWGIQSVGYVRNTKYRMYLHRFLMNVIDTDIKIDHIDGNPLNNRKANLRTCTNQQNLMNKRKYKNNTSGFKGVTFRKDKNKFEAQIMKDGKNIFLGLYDNAKDAAIAYNTKALELHQEFACLNIIYN